MSYNFHQQSYRSYRCTRINHRNLFSLRYISLYCSGHSRLRIRDIRPFNQHPSSFWGEACTQIVMSNNSLRCSLCICHCYWLTCNFRAILCICFTCSGNSLIHTWCIFHWRWCWHNRQVNTVFSGLSSSLLHTWYKCLCCWLRHSLVVAFGTFLAYSKSILLRISNICHVCPVQHNLEAVLHIGSSYSSKNHLCILCISRKHWLQRSSKATPGISFSYQGKSRPDIQCRFLSCRSLHSCLECICCFGQGCNHFGI